MGQIGGDLMNRNVTNPQQAKWGDLDSSEKTARLSAGAIGGLARGAQGMNRPPTQGMGGQMQFNTPSYNGPLFSTGNMPGSLGKNPIFYGGS